MTKRPLQKIIADSGYCSRRRAEDLIKEERVRVNGDVAEPGLKAEPGDRIEIDKRSIETELKEKVYIKVNKPKGYTCTNRKFEGEKNIFDLVPLKTRLFVVGRLDKDSRGLVVLTNDGDWAYKLTHPSFEKEKEYLVKLASQVEDKDLKIIKKKFLKGLESEGEFFKAKRVDQIDKKTFQVVLTQGKNRQIRRMFASLGMEVVDLQRIRLDDISLGGLKSGQYEPLNNQGGLYGKGV